MPSLSIDFSQIRSIDASQRTGFESLCAQLARIEHPNGFIRKGTPDAGVECFAVEPNGDEWAWQAKDITELGDSQWQQIDKSVRTAIDKHPRLVKYYVCLPLDLPDGRIARQMSARDQWNARVKKWTKWATDLGRTIEFVLWDHDVLLGMLKLSKNAGLVRFWFDKLAFDNDWFSKRLVSSIRAAGPRYNPKLNVELPISKVFESFGRTDKGIAEIHRLALKIKETYQPGMLERSILASDAALVAELDSCVKLVLNLICTITTDPAIGLPKNELDQSIEVASKTCDRLRDVYSTYQAKKVPPPPAGVNGAPGISYESVEYSLQRLGRELDLVRETLGESLLIADSQLLLLNGDGGKGKTHLLCDVATIRLSRNLPTILVMGQMLTSTDDPWAQVLRQLDLANYSADEFVGAIEAAAQAFDCRFLFIVDALNEGLGQRIWPSHLEAFLTRLEESPWIATALSVRSHYESTVLPESVSERAYRIEHVGFEGVEYDAVKTYFEHYQLDLPSTPLLQPEFSNPLFLMLLCKGLQGSKRKSIPRGFHGLSGIMEAYLGELNLRLSKQLGFNPKRPLVQEALTRLAMKINAREDEVLPLIEAEDLVDEGLPGKDYEHSLYAALVSERLIFETKTWIEGGTPVDVVTFGFERFLDFFAAQARVSLFDPKDVGSAFEPEGCFFGLLKKGPFITSGQLEALSILLPESSGLELIDLHPDFKSKERMRYAFRNSLVWRDTKAVSDRTVELFEELSGLDRLYESESCLMSLATIVGHPLNAEFLDKWLSSLKIAERDELWSTFLYQAWNDTGGPLDRIVDWARAVTKDHKLDDDAVDLCATALIWMLTASHRFVRDRATKGLISLLTGRIPRLTRLVEKYWNTNDPYVNQRVFAVASGVIMRSPETSMSAAFANLVYRLVFAEGSPPRDILLRDYARIVCERAIFLGCASSIDPSRIRPPYASPWPRIPGEKTIASIRSKQAGKKEGSSHALGAINESIFGYGDFARYIIGTNNKHGNWLNKKLTETKWRSNEDEKLDLIASLSPMEREAWNAHEELCPDDPLFSGDFLRPNKILLSLASETDDSELDGNEELKETIREIKFFVPEVKKADRAARKRLKKALTLEHYREAERLERIKVRNPPYFDLAKIQRYVFWRVFNLGFSAKNFESFDGHHNRPYYSREANKPERMGKKYQWIAYFEIMALLADNFQYYESYTQVAKNHYVGPWQGRFRDIDPSCTLIGSVEGNSSEANARAWWSPEVYELWQRELPAEEWVVQEQDIPKAQNILRVPDSAGKDFWLNLSPFFSWHMPYPAHEEYADSERREIRIFGQAFLVSDEDLLSLKDEFEEPSSVRRLSLDLRKDYVMFLGEHAWSPASDYIEQTFSRESQIEEIGTASVRLEHTVFEYLKEGGGYDCSIDGGYSLRLPSAYLIKELGLTWTGKDAEFADESGEIIAFDPLARKSEPDALLIREASVQAFLKNSGLRLCWLMSGSKNAIPGNHDYRNQSYLDFKGLFWLEDDGIKGDISVDSDIEEEEFEAS